MTLVKQSAKCPFCMETIAAGASRCKHCHADLKIVAGKENKLKQFNNFRAGFIGGVFFTILLGFLIYFQFVIGN